MAMIRPACIVFLGLLAVHISAVSTKAVSPPAEKEEASCLASRVSFDLSSLQTLYLRPEAVLVDVDSFYVADPAYWLTTLWMRDVGYGYPPQGWVELVQQIKDKTPGERREARAVRLARECEVQRDSLLARVLDHVCSFLPGPTTDLTTTVYLTGLIVPNAFQKDFSVVINANACAGPSEVWNTIVHEVFHVGYYRNECYRTETPYHNIERHDLTYSLQNEGMATYVAMTAPRAIYQEVKDYQRLRDEYEVTSAIAKMNELIGAVDSLPPDEFRQRMFEVGVTERALYVCGGHMARTIDERLGREALVSSVATGPRSFVSAYNSLVSDDRRLVEVPLEEPLSACQCLHQEVVNGDYSRAREILGDMRQAGSLNNAAGHVLHVTGQLLTARDSLDLAIEVFEALRVVSPDHKNPHAGLAEAHLRKGDVGAAAEHFRRVLEIAPGDAHALTMLKKLGASSSGP